MLQPKTFRTFALAVACALSMTAHAVADTPKTVNVVAGNLADALETLAKQCGVDVIYPSSQLKGLTTAGVSGVLETRAAFQELLKGTRLVMKEEGGSVLITLPVKTSAAVSQAGPIRVAQSENSGSMQKAGNPDSSEKEKSSSGESASSEADESSSKAIPEILVKGARTLNMDIRRSVEDPQPYVIFDQAAIQRSGATNLEDFLKQQLSMNVVARTTSQGQTGTFTGESSSVNLRGLGAKQTLVLIDGHRVSDMNYGFSFSTGNVNNLPLAAIERVEVLPTTSGGIYGGNATGGVINIVLRRDYVGSELTLGYENTFDGGGATRQLGYSGGFSFEGGRTNVLVAATFLERDSLLSRDRDFERRGIDTILANNPGFFYNAAVPPLAATPNIRSNTRVGGVLQNLTLDNGTPLNSLITFVPEGYPGPASDNGAALAANAGKYNFAPANARTGQTAPVGGGVSLFSAPTRKFLMTTVRREFTASVQGFLEAGLSKNTGRVSSGATANEQTFNNTFVIAATAPNNPFQQDISVTIPTTATDGTFRSEIENRRAVGGVIVKLPRAWQTEVDHNWERNRLTLFSTPAITGAIAAIGNGTINVLRAPSDLYDSALRPLVTAVSFTQDGTRTTLKDTTLRVGGPLAKLPAGALMVSALLEHRTTDMGAATQLNFGGTAHYFPAQSQSVDSAYVEARAPLISAGNAAPGVGALELQAAVRRDDYTSVGGTPFFNVPLTSLVPVSPRGENKVQSTNPTLALRYQSLADLALRASWGTGFLPPDTTQLIPSIGAGSAVTLTDPRRGGNSFSVSQGSAFPFGGNPNLQPEQSESWSAGAILTPRVLPGFRLSIDYTDIKKTDNIANLSLQQILDNEAVLGSRVTRGAKLAGDPADWAGPVTGIDQTAVNVAKAELRAFDLQLDHRQETAAGTFEFFARATRTLHYHTQLVPTVAVVENVGVTRNNPLKLKANAGLIWLRGPWTLGWSSVYFDSYLVSTTTTTVLNQGNRGKVASQVYHDAFASYRFADSAAQASSLSSELLSGAEIQLGVKNVFNKKPPFDASDTVYYSAFGDPRLASYYVSLKKAFGR